MSRHKHGGDIYTTSYRLDFSANVNPLGMPEGVLCAARRGVELCGNYPDVSCAMLRRALAKKEGVPESALVFGNGAAELIFSLAQAERPKKALLIAPGFAEYEQALRAQECEIRYYPLRESCGFALGEDYLDFLAEDLDIIFLCNPNNPTGVAIPPHLLSRIAQLCEERGIRMVLDVCFRDFLDVPEDTDLAPAEYPHLFLLKAFTKTYAMAGLRLGYGVCADERLIARMEDVRQPWSVSIPAQMVGAAALEEEAYVRRARELVKRERAWLRGQLEALGFTVYDSAANFLFFRGEKGLAKRCKAQGILIRDCGNYRGLESGYYRVAVKRHEENEELVRALAGEKLWQR